MVVKLKTMREVKMIHYVMNDMTNGIETQKDDRIDNDHLCNKNMNAMSNAIETQNDESIDNDTLCHGNSKVDNTNNIDNILNLYVQCQNNCKIGILTV